MTDEQILFEQDRHCLGAPYTGDNSRIDPPTLESRKSDSTQHYEWELHEKYAGPTHCSSMSLGAQYSKGEPSFLAQLCIIPQKTSLDTRCKVGINFIHIHMQEIEKS